MPGAEASRTRTPLAEWQFAAEDSAATVSGGRTLPSAADWKMVTVPHVFRQSGLPDDAAGWYRKTVHLDESDRGSSFYLSLEGAASVKDVFVNGRRVGQHRGLVL